MAFTGHLGTNDSRPGDIILGGNAPSSGGPEVYDRALESSLTLSQEATCNMRNAEAVNTLTPSQEASCPQIYHRSVTVAIPVTQALESSINQYDVVSSLTLTSTARASINELEASSPISVTHTATSNIRMGRASSPITVTVEAICENARAELISALTLTHTAELIGVPLYKTASSPIGLTQVATGVGPIRKTATSELTLTDDVRSNIRIVSAGSSLILDQSTHKAEEYIATAANPLSLVDVSFAVNMHVHADSKLDLLSFADTVEKRRDATTELTLTDAATADKVKIAISTLSLISTAAQGIVNLSVSSELSLTDLARIVSIKIVASPDAIELMQEAISSIKMLAAESSLVLDQSINVIRPWRVGATSELTTIEQVYDPDTFSFVDQIIGLHDEAGMVIDRPQQITQIISFSTQASRTLVKVDAIAADAESTLTLTQEGRLSKQEASESQLALTQSATGVAGIGVESKLDALGVEASYTVVRANISAENTLEIVQAVRFVVEGQSLCTYNPFIGGSSDPNAPTPPPVSYKEPGLTEGFRLQYPSDGVVTDEVVLRSPNLGNIDRLSMVRINRETRGGTLIVFADPIWPKVQTLLLTFSGLSYAESQALLVFMETHIGEEIRLIDWEDRVWRGVIVNPQDPVVQDGRGCKYTASFEFEGEKV